MRFRQRTLAQTVRCSGIGVHSGKRANLAIKPAPINHGIKFTRTDLRNCPTVSAHFRRVVDTSLATVIGCEGVIVSTVEHLMAAFAGLAIDNALVELDSYEMPIMDGSAGPFTRLIQSAGIQPQASPRCFFVIKEPIKLEKGDKSVAIYPSSTYRITCRIEYAHPLIQHQRYSVVVNERNFESEISRARTFGFVNDIEYLKRYGFARGGSLENAIVVDDKTVLNQGGLRFPDEFVRHKILDCIGDFSLLGMPILGHVVVQKSGHRFNHDFLWEFFARKDSWETLLATQIFPAPHAAPKQVAI